MLNSANAKYMILEKQVNLTELRLVSMTGFKSKSDLKKDALMELQLQN